MTNIKYILNSNIEPFIYLYLTRWLKHTLNELGIKAKKIIINNNHSWNLWNSIKSQIIDDVTNNIKKYWLTNQCLKIGQLYYRTLGGSDSMLKIKKQYKISEAILWHGTKVETWKASLQRNI